MQSSSAVSKEKFRSFKVGALRKAQEKVEERFRTEKERERLDEAIFL